MKLHPKPTYVRNQKARRQAQQHERDDRDKPQIPPRNIVNSAKADSQHAAAGQLKQKNAQHRGHSPGEGLSNAIASTPPEQLNYTLRPGDPMRRRLIILAILFAPLAAARGAAP